MTVVSTASITHVSFIGLKTLPQQLLGQGPGAVVKQVKATCLENRRSRVRPPLWHSSFKEAKCFFPAHSQRLNIVGSLRDQEVYVHKGGLEPHSCQF